MANIRVKKCGRRAIIRQVKAEENLKAKSLKAFMDKHADLHAIRFSMSPYKKQDWLTNIPLYGVREMKA